MSNDRTIEPAYFEFATNATDGDITTATHIALITVEGDGTRTTTALAVQDAEVVGKLLIGHADAVAQRPPRDW
ncbi:hypothetical protein A5699_14170 [Mycobacterium sp. E802]|uniref:hypothetical protein n=1 Tax=Mycobacterium sp. E802 TaxID=1834152 RepID=UPI0007FE34C2|nr:hypothetical protein [Mycobacterium sp. E802]OBG89403.1 hypothetical protein A5699_14170 [Mycobacterium sp. E802]